LEVPGLVLVKLNDRAVARCRGQTGVACNQGGAEALGQRHEGRIVGGQVVPEFPDSIDQGVVGITNYRQLLKVPQGVDGSVLAETGSRDEPAQGVKDLDVDQMRSMKIRVIDKPV
jgi:hypothetical protein